MQRLGVALVESLVLWSMGLIAVLLKRLLRVQLLHKVAGGGRINGTRKGFRCQEAFNLILAKHYFSNDVLVSDYVFQFSLSVMEMLTLWKRVIGSSKDKFKYQPES